MNLNIFGTKQTNTLSLLRESGTKFLFSIKNSTLSLGTLTFEEGKHGICEGSADSYCSLTKCIVAFNGRISLFESDGIVSIMWSQIEPSFDISTSSLANSGSGKMTLLLIGNSFTNWRSHETSLSGTGIARLDLSLCHFVNVSHMCSPRHQPLHQTLQKTLISGNTLSQVENDLYGALFRDMNNMNEIHAINTTFTASYHSELNSYTTQYPSTVATSTAGNSFQNCLFKGCRTGASGGGLFHNNAAPLSVTSCGFESCRSEPTETVTGTHGGGLFVLTTATAAVTIDIKKSTFKSCYASYRGSGFDLRSGNAVRVLKITLEDLTLESNSGMHCVCFVAMYLTDPTLSNITCQDSNATHLEAGGRLEHVNGETKMTSVLLLNLIANGNAAFALDQLSGTVRFEHLKIANGRTNQNAQFAIGANLVDMPQGSITFTDCFFEHNVETTGQITGASDITFHGGSVTYPYREMFVNCWTASGQPSLSVKNVQNSEWIVTNDVIDVNNQTGQDALFCWIPGSQCRTMTDVIGNRLGPWYVGKIAMAEGEYHETKLMMKNQSLVVEGRGSTQTTMLDAGSDTTLFTITTGKLSASSLQFVPFASSHLITLSDEGTVSVSDSSVQTVVPSVKLSKAVFSVAAGTLLLTRVECSSLSFTDTAVLFLFSSLARSLTLKNSSFESISSSGGGSCISTTISEGQSVQIGEQGGSDSFSSCTSDGDGGALNAKLSLSGSLTIVSTHFSDCSSSGRGGALFVELDRTNSETEWSFDLSGTSFGSDSEKNTATKGQNIFILGAFFETTVDPSVLPAVTAATDKAEMWGEDGNSTVDSTLLVYLVPFENKAVVGGTNAFDIPHCGHFGVGCVSIQNAFNQVKTSASPSLTLSFETEATLSESFSFETAQTVTFESATQSKPTIEVKASGRLSVSSGTLVLSTLSFTSSVSPFSSSFITLSGGSLSVSGCSFTGISSSESGGVVKGTVSRSSSLIVTGSEFTSCSSSLNGGAISVTCAPDTPSSCLVIKATFDSCWCGSESKGDWVFVSGSGLPSLVDPPNWETTTTGLTQPTDSSKLWGSDSSPSESSLSSSTLLVYLLPHSAGSIFTSSSSGSEEIGCGEPSTPCKKLSTSLSRISSSPNSLSIQDSATLDFTLTSSLADLTVTGLTTPQKTLSIASNGGITSTSNKLSFALLAFTPSEANVQQALFILSGTGSLVLHTCSISSFSSSTNSKVLSGTVETGKTISIIDTSFVSCSATSASGIVDVTVSGTGELKMEGTTKFESCTLTDHGHLVLVQCADLPAFIAKDTISVLTPTRPTNRLFTEAEKEDFWGKEVSGDGYSLLYLWFEFKAGYLHVHSNGEDDGRCGEDVLPCSSLSHSMDKMKNGVVLVDSAFPQTSLLTSVASTWTLQGDILKQLTLSDNGGFEVKLADTVLTLSTLNIVTGSVGTRTTSALSVSGGKLVVSSCTFGVSSSDFVLPLCSVDGGNVEFFPSLSVIRPSPSMPMLFVLAGSLLVNEFALTHSSTTRTSHLLRLTGGRTTLKGSFSTFCSSIPPISVTSEAVLALTDSTSTLSSDLTTNLVALNGGSMELTGSILTFTRPSCLLAGSGSASIVSSSLTCKDPPIASNSGTRSMSITLSVGQSLKIGEENKAVSFDGWKSAENGGALGVEIAGGSLSIIHTTFTSCSSSLNGGAISVTCAPDTPSSCLVIKATFGSCWCGSESKGDWVFVSGSGLPSLVDPLNWETTTTGLTQPTDSSKLWGSDSSPSESSLSSSTLLVYLLPHSAGSIFTSSSSGSEEIGCGEPSTPCKKLSTSLSRISSSPNSLSIQDSATLDFTLTSSLADLTVTGLTTPQKTLSIASNGGITSTSNKLSFVFLAFSTTTELFSHTLISIHQTGSVSVTSCSFSSFSLSDSPLFDHQNGELNLKSCSFSNIHRSEGNGSCVHSALSGNMLLKVDDVWMTDVDVSEGSGDGIFVSFPSTLSSNVASFSLTNLHFASSPSMNADSSKSRFLFLTGFNFSSWIEVGDARFKGSFEGSDVKADWLWTEDQHADIKLPASLLFYLTEHVGAVGVDESGFNTANCGFQTVWCPTLPMALDRLSTAQSSSVVVQVRVEINTTIAFTSSTVLTGLTESSQLEIGEDALFEVHTANVDLEITSLVFSLPPTLSSTSLFAVTEGSLTLSSVSFVSSDQDNLFSSQLINTAAPLSLTSVNVSSASLSSVALIESWSDVLVAGCRFSSISRSTGLGSVIEANISLSTSLKIVHTTFENCESDSTTNWILLKGQNDITKKNTSWEGTFTLSSPRKGVLVDDLDDHGPYSLLYSFYPADEWLIVSSGDRSEDHRLCGHGNLPCLTIAGSLQKNDIRKLSVRGSCLFGGEVSVKGKGLKVSGVNENEMVMQMDGASRIIQNSEEEYPSPITLSYLLISIDSSTLPADSSLIRLEKGTLDLTSCSFSSKKRISSKMIEMLTGTLKFGSVLLHDLSFSQTPIVLSSMNSVQLNGVTISDCSALSVISAKDSPLINIQKAIVERVKSLSANNETEALCHWTGAVIMLDECHTTVDGSRFADLDEGAFSLVGGSLDVHLSGFEETHDESTFFPSAHRNIHCEQDGNISISSISGGDGSTESPSLWVDSSACLLQKNNQSITAPLFIPTLDTARSGSKRAKSLNKITLVGTMLMPCELFLEVYSVQPNKAETGHVQSINLSSVATNWTETSLTVELNETTDFPNLKSDFEWHARLAFGLGTDKTSSFRVKLSAADDRKAQMKQAMKWMIPLIAGIAILILFLIILAVLLRKRKKDKEQKKAKLSEMGEVNQPIEDIIKYDDGTAEITDQFNRMPFDTPTERQANLIDTKEHFPEGDMNQAKDLAEAIPAKRTDAETVVYARGVDGKEVRVINVKDTLYSRLHEQTEPQAINRTQLQLQLIASLKAIQRHEPDAQILTQLNPHAVFFDAAGVMCLQTHQHPHHCPSEFGAKQEERTEATSNSKVDRWKAPEAADGKDVLDRPQAAIFSLGLLLWEIETGIVPFREVDAINAQRQLGSGQLPPMDKIESDGFAELIRQCLELDPKNRPTLEEVEKALSPPSLHQPSQKLSRKPVPFVNRVEMP
ncbi:hypothetical protein BLNAU_2180 [Blattamonas nauphoetae]|uniref:Protein kinase domain-containing protein n=1 Tax=Blattamonas nauphoetae TaxID=2049346 RepID=A0ABQ9YG43_9EUKA|nr:hypothetical protein BLNAU_2180 [Blattamonas nauphoetae]